MTLHRESHPGGEGRFSLSFTYGTHNPALMILREMGYELSVISDKDGGGSTFVATAPGHRFAAGGGAELLGLVTIWEHYGGDWNRQEPNLMSELIRDEDEV